MYDFAVFLIKWSTFSLQIIQNLVKILRWSRLDRNAKYIIVLAFTSVEL